VTIVGLVLGTCAWLGLIVGVARWAPEPPDPYEDASETAADDPHGR
jgi:hypothetical protein